MASGSYHYPGRAVDLVGDRRQLRASARYLCQLYGVPVHERALRRFFGPDRRQQALARSRAQVQRRRRHGRPRGRR